MAARFRLQASGPESIPASVRLHLETCPDCRRRADALAQAARTLRDPGTQPALSIPKPDVLAARLAARLERPPVRRLPAPIWAIPAIGALGAVALVAAHLLSGVPGTPPPGDEPAITLSGSAHVTSGGRAPVTVSHAAAAHVGDRVLADDGEAVLADPAVGTLILAPGTLLRIEAWGPRAVVLLESGRLDATVQPRGPGEGFEIRTDLAVARVVGTRFVVDHRPDDRTEVRVIQGTVSVMTPQGTEAALLPAGGVARLGPGTTHPDPAADSAPPKAQVAATPPARPASAPRSPGHREDPAAPAPDPVPQPVADLMARVRALATAGGEGDAVEALSRALPMYPDHRPRLLALLGDLHRASGRRDQAQAAWQESIATWPGAAPEGVHVDLARSLEELGRPVDAERAWEECLRQHPRGRMAGLALERIASLEEAAGHSDRARALWKRLLDEAPESPQAVPTLAAVGLALRASGDLEGAAAWFGARTGSDAPALAEAALVGLLRVRLEQGRIADVRALAAEHAARFPGGPRAAEVARVVEALGTAR